MIYSCVFLIQYYSFCLKVIKEIHKGIIFVLPKMNELISTVLLAELKTVVSRNCCHCSYYML